MIAFVIEFAALFLCVLRPFFISHDFNEHMCARIKPPEHLFVGALVGAWFAKPWPTRHWLIFVAMAMTIVEVLWRFVTVLIRFQA